MKKRFALLLALALIAGSFMTVIAEEDYNETGVLYMLWHGAAGTDGRFECTYIDWQSSFPDLVYDCLVKLDMEDNSKIIPRMAESWEISEDNLTYTFTIRDGLTWRDGVAVTPEDFLWSVKAKIGFNGPVNDRGSWEKNQRRYGIYRGLRR